MSRELIKGNEAIIKAALLSGCESFYGYPITPASEIAHAAALLFPRLGRTFLQAESEIASINMVYGAAGAGERTMTASSSPGISLKMEGISYLCGAELPCVIVDIMRGGPGLGNIAPEQSDYNQVVKGGGHGSYEVITLAPNGAQEMADMTSLAFDLADKWRNPVFLLADGYVGQMMEPVEFHEPEGDPPEKDWTLKLENDIQKNLVTSIHLDPDKLEDHNLHLQKKYQAIREEEVRFERFQTEDADLVLIGFGIVSRILHSVVERARENGLKVGLLRPRTLWPFPSEEIRKLCDTAQSFLTVELNAGQMVDDVKLAVLGRRPVYFYGRMGGQVPTVEEVYEVLEAKLQTAAGSRA
ncbi:MAG: 3-methyl-2-oxobutanoate dehydrogenase subunit VorB [Candidatus Krumholzibacteria bacterium]|jgi:pyruvate/2-oxoacid:ferredoxin oxidoreductase alpha subunit|nr:3-methyl-2-oxobutanoate dehydrogenase subunit VorB [Candidatus Krumholzibacteria bacterium]MDP6668320.1 3-methyl-2-oxobutanoate dehydrogenase subunit VorB [Candidatus Krumholzibacteria bacterium]MDP6798103.1 3-methyl-2-oxobutanoate dehydrogenase subunit VorB [Candidatus Krumholzibacteria bacterium]MDP7022124.1 3-methyl-2-oxobutanoate dehydrogenase subunit VorB [Candidatus Krumholzibacteria bacterium]